MKKIDLLFRLFLSVSMGLSFLLGFESPQAQAADTFVEIVSPAPGTVVVPEKAVFTFRFTGERASILNECDSSFRFWLTGSDGAGKTGLFARENSRSVDQGVISLVQATPKIIPNGIECTIDLTSKYRMSSPVRLVPTFEQNGWAKTYLEDHKQVAGENEVSNFVRGWNSLILDPSQIREIKVSGEGLSSGYTMKQATFPAISNAVIVNTVGITRGATWSTGKPVPISYSTGPTDRPKSVSLFITQAGKDSVDQKCLLTGEQKSSSGRTLFDFSCRIPRLFAPGQVSIQIRSVDQDDFARISEPVIINLEKSLREKLVLNVTATNLNPGIASNSTRLRINGKVEWQSEDGTFPLAGQAVWVCTPSCPMNASLVTSPDGTFGEDYFFANQSQGSTWEATWSVKVKASDLEDTKSGSIQVKSAPKLQPQPTPSSTEPPFNLQLSIKTRSKINWGDPVVAIVTAKGVGSGTCIAQYQDQLATFSLKAGQSKTVKILPKRAVNQKLPLNIGCAPNQNWWGRFFDPRYSWNYARVRTYTYVTMFTSSNLD